MSGNEQMGLDLLFFFSLKIKLNKKNTLKTFMFILIRKTILLSVYRLVVISMTSFLFVL